MLKILALFFVLLTLVACPKDYEQGFRFSNNSTRDVYIYLGVANRDMGGSLYPDTAVSRLRVGIPFTQGETRKYSYSRAKENIWIDTLCLFIFDADTFNTYNWEEIQSDYKVLQRYDMNYENIKALKYYITYPPDERMRDIKMYPPYGE